VATPQGGGDARAPSGQSHARYAAHPSSRVTLSSSDGIETTALLSADVAVIAVGIRRADLV
jgi:hypothetical protein